ncbi:MAG TPA: ABC transporter permease [Kiritimatiellia bacterium]|jgi:putative ABC transport system permease protein|nr:ABC transporter permease [Kiritimatiellia bacterium]OQC59383.1 MAG: Macrolide export ATP-binding/permease protein MacB [Verrucomicrobia bacterium ADurb.Bin018]MBP9572216.1 ABC transporter permease [Kiritimatiellia bacterium]HOE00504.1 ABC transporter permease [Kiritimatiellia bacterium]HOE37004.1 ABC transporter permease [Kiritimatiellia bacterium]
MNLTSFAWKNLTRRPVRTMLTAGGVGLAVAVAVSLGGFNLGYRQAIAGSIEQLGFQVMVMAKGCPYEAATMMLKGGSGLLYLPEEAHEQIRTDPDIEDITPIFIGIAEKQNYSLDGTPQASAYTIMSGVELDSFVTMKPWLKFKHGPGYDGGRWFAPTATNEVVMGYEVAEYEQRKVGDTFYATVVPNGKVEPELHAFTVVGVLDRTGAQDDGTVFLPLPAAQAIFGRPGELTIIGIKLKEFNGIRMREFEGRWLKIPEVQVVSLEQVKGALVSLVGTAQTMVAAVALIAVLVAMIGVVNAILMSVHERTSELGVLKAIGAGRAQIFRLVWLETLLISLAGAVPGSLVATAGARLTDLALRKVLNIGVTQSLVRITPGLLGVVIVGAVVLSLLAGIWPAGRAANLRPVEAIRSGE